jgi:type III restriction enzyme
VRVATGDEPLNLILEVKGLRGADAQLKAETARTQWVEGVNNLGSHGRWDFAEFREPFDMQKEFDALVASKVEKVTV